MVQFWSFAAMLKKHSLGAKVAAQLEHRHEKV